MPSSQNSQFFNDVIPKNQHELGRYFQELYPTLDGEENWRKRRVLALVIRLKAYEQNDIKKIIEFLNDLKTAHESQVKFYEKYKDELFIFPDVAASEFEELNFINDDLLPFISKLVS